MTSLRSLSFVLVLSLPSLAFADETLVSWTERRVDEALVKPLAKREGGSRFSRSRPPPRERRVRVLQSEVSHDAKGRAFVPFAVDVRFGPDAWHENDVVGCAYRDSGNLFVRFGDEYRPASVLLGKEAGAVAGVCQAAPPAKS